MTISRYEIITGREGRRRWTREEKERLVAASFEPGVTASEVARSAGLHTSQLFHWRKQLCERTGPRPPALLPVTIAEPETAPPASNPPNGTAPRKRTGRRRAADRIEIELGGGRCIRVDANVDVAALRRVLDVLERR